MDVIAVPTNAIKTACQEIINNRKNSIDPRLKEAVDLIVNDIIKHKVSVSNGGHLIYTKFVKSNDYAFYEKVQAVFGSQGYSTRLHHCQNEFDDPYTDWIFEINLSESKALRG